MNNCKHLQDNYGGLRLRLTIEEAARMCGWEPEQVLTWLRAGMPYVEAGDWETGEGFVLNSAWTLDWHVLVASRLLRAATMRRHTSFACQLEGSRVYRAPLAYIDRYIDTVQ